MITKIIKTFCNGWNKMKKLSSRSYKIHKITDFIGVILLVCLLLFIWQLYRGSISLPFLKPYIIKALNHDDTDYQVTLDGVNLELVRSVQPLRIIAGNVTYKKEGAITITAPKVALSFSIKALLRGIIAPSTIEVEQPKILIFSKYGLKKDKKQDSGEVSRQKLKYYFEQAENFWEHFNSEDNVYPESYINSIEITRADVELLEVDLGKKWQFSDVNYSFDRGFSELTTEINALMPFNDSTSSLGLSVSYDYSDNKAAMKFYFSDLIPADLLELLTPATSSDDFYNIKVPLHGELSTELNLQNLSKYRENILANSEKIIDYINFDFKGEKGVIKFSSDESYDYNISGLILEGQIGGNLESVKISDAGLNLDGQKASLGLEIKGLKEYLLHSSLKDMSIDITAKVPVLETDKLTVYWPKYFGDKAWKWCKESLFDGKIKNGDFTFGFAYDKKNKGISFNKLKGTAYIEGGTLLYLNEMPKVTDIYGKATFSENNIIIEADKAKSADVILNKGYIDLYDLNAEDNFLKLQLSGIGSISDILRLIDHEPLKYPSSIGLKPETVKGSAIADLSMDFELKEDLEPEEVNVKVSAVLQDVVMKDIFKGKSVEAKSLNLELDNQHMLLSGVANVEGLPLSFEWYENFTSADYLRKYNIGFNFDNSFKEKLGLDIKALSAPYITGTIPAKAVITMYSNNKTIADVHGNLKGTKIDYSFLGYKKETDVIGEITAQLDIKGDKVVSIPKFSLSKPDFKINGQVGFDTQGRVKNIDISDIKGPKTNAKAKIDFLYSPQEQIKVIVSGSSYDLSEFFAEDKDDEQDKSQLTQAVTPKKTDDWEENVPNININIAVDKLWTGKDIGINNFAGSAKLKKGIGVDDMHLVGNFSRRTTKEKAPSQLKLDYNSRPNGEYLLSINSNDAGSALRFLHLYDYVRGGSLSINAKRGIDKRFVGHIKGRDFNVVKTNIFAKLLTLSSLSGMVDMLSGDGIAFTHFDAPFEYYDSEFKLNGAKAFGNVIGISGSGKYNGDTELLSFSGMIAPAYGLNSFIGKIPLVGNLLSGRDGTVFAVNYTIKGNIDNPDISINPLSALSPNSLKDIWNDNFVKNQ